MSRIPFGPDAINMLVDLLEQRNLLEIELADKDTRIRVVRAGTGSATSQPMPDVNRARPSTGHEFLTAQPNWVERQPRMEDSPGLVRSETVGIAYLGPDPEAAPFVTLGEKVVAGQTLLLIEAMKTFTDVVAPLDGVVAEILVRSGDMVDYGMPLLRLE